MIILDFELTQRQGFHASQPYRISAVYEPSTAVLVEESRKQLTLREQDIEKAKGWVLLDSILEATQVSKILSSLTPFSLAFFIASSILSLFLISFALLFINSFTLSIGKK